MIVLLSHLAHIMMIIAIYLFSFFHNIPISLLASFIVFIFSLYFYFIYFPNYSVFLSFAYFFGNLEGSVCLCVTGNTSTFKMYTSTVHDYCRYCCQQGLPTIHVFSPFLQFLCVFFIFLFSY